MNASAFRLLSLRELVFTILVGVGSLVTPVQAQTVTKTVSTIYQFEVVTTVGGAPGNYDFRVFLPPPAGSTNPAQICGSGPNQNFMYINDSETNYSAMVSNLINARNLGATVNFYWALDSNSFCHLAYIMY